MTRAHTICTRLERRFVKVMLINHRGRQTLGKSGAHDFFGQQAVLIVSQENSFCVILVRDTAAVVQLYYEYRFRVPRVMTDVYVAGEHSCKFIPGTVLHTNEHVDNALNNQGVS